MNSSFQKLFELLKKERGITYLTLFLSFLLIFPFLVLTFYTNPSIDDYAFPYYVLKLGFWKSQINWYTTWTGRYSSSFLLSLHPLIFNSLLMYKALSLLLFLLTIHSVYWFLFKLFFTSQKLISLIISIVFSFLFINSMPNITQGFYWLTGSITYQLANPLMLYLLTNLLLKDKSNLKIVINGFLILIVCGLNETAMAALLTTLVGIFLYKSIFFKKVNIRLFGYSIFTIICSLTVVFAPGNIHRAKGFEGEGRLEIVPSIIHSLQSTFQFIIDWLFTPQMLIFSISIFLFTLFREKTDSARKKNDYLPFIILLSGITLIAASLGVAYIALGTLPPSRTINITYWVFICSWTAFLITLFRQFKTPVYLHQNLSKAIISCLILIIGVVSAFNGNYAKALKDLTSGDAKQFNKEFYKRDHFLRNTTKKEVNVNSFSVFPSVVFNVE